MVHALREAHRVLKPAGLLIDIRPGAAHGRIGIERDARWRYVVASREDLTDDHAANAAVRAVIAEGLFRREAFDRFELRRVVGSLRTLRDWLAQLGMLGTAPGADAIVARVGEARRRAGSGTRIVTVGPLELRALRKR